MAAKQVAKVVRISGEIVLEALSQSEEFGTRRLVRLYHELAAFRNEDRVPYVIFLGHTTVCIRTILDIIIEPCGPTFLRAEAQNECFPCRSVRHWFNVSRVSGDFKSGGMD